MNPLAALATIATPDEAQLTTRAQSALRMVESMTIENDDDYTNAADELKAIKSKAHNLEAQRTAITGPINAGLKLVNDLFRGPAKFLADAESTIKQKMLGYSAAQEKIAADARRAAEALAAAERTRLAAEAQAIADAAAEVQRKADAEQREQQAALAKQAAEATAAGNKAAAEAAQTQALAAREKAASEAAAARQAADLEVAAIQNIAAVIVAPVTTAEPAKVSGISSAKTFDFEVTNMLALVQYVALHPEFIGVLKTDDVKLRGLVKSLGENLRLDGVRVFTKTTLRAA